jgi:hypothetical protein
MRTVYIDLAIDDFLLNNNKHPSIIIMNKNTHDRIFCPDFIFYRVNKYNGIELVITEDYLDNQIKVF